MAQIQIAVIVVGTVAIIMSAAALHMTVMVRRRMAAEKPARCRRRQRWNGDMDSIWIERGEDTGIVPEREEAVSGIDG